jgi:hypothetical protein
MRYLGWLAFTALVLSTVTALGKDEKTQADALLSFAGATMSSSVATRTAAHHTPAQRASSPGRADCY